MNYKHSEGGYGKLPFDDVYTCHGFIRRNLHIFYYNLQLIFSCKRHLQLKWLIVALDKLHKTLVTNNDVIA
jgi:hypothetical protein